MSNTKFKRAQKKKVKLFLWNSLIVMDVLKVSRDIKVVEFRLN